MDKTTADILFGVLDRIKDIKSYHDMYANIIVKIVSEIGIDLGPKPGEVVDTNIAIYKEKIFWGIMKDCYISLGDIVIPARTTVYDLEKYSKLDRCIKVTYHPTGATYRVRINEEGEK